jgi:hypothetical protein
VGSLSDYIDVLVTPEEWNAAYKPITYKGAPYGGVLSAVTDNGGFAQFNISSAFTLTLVVGQTVNVSTGVYEGFHVIKSIQSTTLFTVETDYISAISGTSIITYLPVIQFDLYKGYATGETYEVELPYEKIATFKVEPNMTTFEYTWNVSGYLQSIFSIQYPISGIDFNMFNRFRLVFGSDDLEYYQVANSAIDNPEFDTIYANTGQPLNDTDTIVFNCGKTVQSFIIGDTIQNTFYNNGD